MGRGPEQIHLAFTGQEDEMRVMFVTHDGHDSYVRYGLRKNLLELVAATKVGRYEREDMCDAPANESVGWRDPGYIHDGVMTGLLKGKRYYYKVGSDPGGWSTIHSFVSRNEDSDKTVAFIFGDMGTATPYRTFLRTQDESISTIKWIKRDCEALGRQSSFISHIGDLSYARGYGWLWDNFFTQIESIAATVPYHVCIGNHEYNWPRQPWRPNWSQTTYGTDGGGECGVPYSLRFNMPGNSSEITGTHAPPTRNLYYSFSTGSVHFLYISTETNFLLGSSQYNFIKHDLESVDRNKYPFVVVQGHRPMYTTNSYKEKGGPLMKRMVDHLEPLFVEAKVNLVLWGHVHSYERFCPMKNYTCGGDFSSLPLHVVIGMGGQDWQSLWEARPDHPTDPIFPQPEQSMYRTGEYGYTRLVADKEKLIYSFVGNHDGKVHDEVTILASGQVLSGNGNDATYGMMAGSMCLQVMRGISILVLGTFIGYILGYISHAKREFALRKKWSQEIALRKKWSSLKKARV